ncbi:hypothetical protein GH741_11200 [Aquibacillus halophilus]|uniref:DUF3221 domain-containing protein n=1 Tax=Aquibacillus halophilus TaxID=930132 RepID=A0A6A8DFE6_9BACI|nr:hypothetical protein [Aquibacillus halophilus]MRH43246.1 hypothetical protein [Aquibacillus halophilus]
MRVTLFSLLLCISILIVGCNSKTFENSDGSDKGNPVAKEILSENKDADIFATINVVYRKAESVSWVEDLELSLGDEYFEITKQSTNPKEFESGTASKLPIGTKVYSPVEKHGRILIAVVDGEQIRYLGLVEG